MPVLAQKYHAYHAHYVQVGAINTRRGCLSLLLHVCTYEYHGAE